MEQHNPKTAAELRQALREGLASSDAAAAVAGLFDEGTFVEIGSYVKRRTTEFDLESAEEFEGVITGYGAVDGHLVFAFAQDLSRSKGAVSEAHAKKICRLYDMAIKNQAPVVGIFNSAGAAVMEGVDALSGYGKIMKKVSAAAGIIPQIAAVTGICSGAAAAILGMFDFTVATDDAKIFVTPPFLLREKEKGREGAKEVGSADACAKIGLVSLRAADAPAAMAEIRRLLSYLPSVCGEGAVELPTGDDLNRLTTGVAGTVAEKQYDMTAVLSEICDFGSLLPLSSAYAPELITALATIGGGVVAIVANQPAEHNGNLTAAAANKAADFIAFADCFDIPVITLVDTEGYAATLADEGAPYASALSRLAYAYATAECPLITAVLGKAYGAAFTLMGSRSLGADIAFALESAKISILPPESAVEVLNGTAIKASKAPGKDREYFLKQWNNTISSPLAAARSGDIDDIIEPAELRMRIAAALEMLTFKED